MLNEDWLERWLDNRIGFHQKKVNSRLKKFWPELKLETGSTIFVPLCGKSIDMLWLSEQGFSVIGIEISEVACRDFFSENNLAVTETTGDRFTVFDGINITLLQGDFFSLTAGDLSEIKGTFDRASLIALPDELRIRYSKHLADIVPVASKTLLISMDYDQSKMKGPPYSVNKTEVESLFSQKFDLEIVSESSGPDIVGNLKDRGLDTLNESIYVLTRK